MQPGFWRWARLAGRRTAVFVLLAGCLASTAASGAQPKGHIYECSIYRAPIHRDLGDAIITFRNWVAPALPGGAHGEPPYDCVGAAAHLTVADPRSTDEWSATRPHHFRKLGLACLFHLTWFGEYVTVTVRSVWLDDPVCTYLATHSGP
jgi:hypothetical protein